jgi:hypothetical protein
MGLRIYSVASGGTPISNDGLFTNALIISEDGRVGGATEQLLYLRADDATYSYTSIQLEMEQIEGSVDLVGGTEGFAMKLNAGATQPAQEQWSTIQSGSTISLSDISGLATAVPFWLRVEVPSGVPVQQFRGVRFKITATQSV